jgi:uncharacterized damage-inducible protein DinB
MHALFTSITQQLQDLHAEAEGVLNGLPPAALDWKPEGKSLSDTNSVAVLIVHLTGSERYWIGDVAGGEPSGRDREAEFRTRGMDTAALRQRLADTLAHSRRVLERLEIADLESPRVSTQRKDETFTVAWAITHALEHTAVHIGHLHLTRQWWEAQHPNR